MNKYEKLIEYIIAEQDDLARQLFHEIVVEKSRQIYESLGEDDMMDGMHGGVNRSSPIDGLMDEVEADEITREADGDEPEMDMDMDMDMDDEEGDMDMDMGDEDGDMDMDDEEGDMDMDMGDEEGDMDMGDEELEDRVVDLEAALDELKAEFDALMADNDGDGDHDMDDHEAEDEDEDDMTKEGLREYVEKVSAPANAEGHEVGAGKSVPVQKASPGLQKANNMGGKRFDLGRGSENAPDGQRPQSHVKAPQEVDVAKRNVNKVGGNKGAQDFYGTKAKAKSGEDGGVNKHSIEPGSK